MKNNRIRDLIRQAQAAELEGDKQRAVGLLQEAAQLHLDASESGRAAALLRHCLRLDPERTDLKSVLDRAERTSAVEPSERPALHLPDRGPVFADPALDCWCSFCCRPRTEAGAMIAGPAGAFICTTCLRRACDLFGAPPPAEPPAHPERQVEVVSPGEGVAFVEAAVILSRSLGWSLAEVRSLSPAERYRAIQLLDEIERSDSKSDIPRA